MKPKQLVLRCYGEQKGKYWQAFCLDLNLAVQAGSFEEVQKKMNEQISSYLYDALEGEDCEYADQLLNRKAPFYFWIKYYTYMALCKFHAAKDGICSIHRLFNQVMPLTISQRRA